MSFARNMKLSIVASAFLIALTGCRGASVNPQPQPTEPPTIAPSATPPADSETSASPADTGQNAPSAKPSAAASTGIVTAVRLADPKSGWTAGEGWIARTDDAGKHWSIQYQDAGTVRQLFALNGTDAWATVEGSAGGSSGGYSLLGTSDGGKHWTKAGAVPNKGFLHFVTKSEAYSANAKTTDGGKTWSTLPVPEGLVGDAYFHDAKNGWAVAQGKDAASIMRTADGGKSWTTVMSRPLAEPLTGALIRSAGAEDAWVEWVGGSGMTQTSYSLFHTSDGGKSWITVLANSTAGAGPAPGFTMDNTEGHKNEGSGPGPLYVVNPSTAFMGGYCGACDLPNSVGKTTDGGKTWINGTQSIEGYAGALLAMADAKQGWWIGTDRTSPSVMYTTSDGGAHWTKAHTFDKPKSAS